MSLLRNTTTSPVACASARLLPSAKPWFSGLWCTCTRSPASRSSAAATSARGAVVPDDHLESPSSASSDSTQAVVSSLSSYVGTMTAGQPGGRRAGLERGPVDEVPVEHDAAPVAGRGPQRAPAVREPAAYADARHQLDLGAAGASGGRAARPPGSAGSTGPSPSSASRWATSRAGSTSGAGVRKTTVSPLPRSPSSSSATNGRPSATSRSSRSGTQESPASRNATYSPVARARSVTTSQSVSVWFSTLARETARSSSSYPGSRTTET